MFLTRLVALALASYAAQTFLAAPALRAAPRAGRAHGSSRESSGAFALAVAVAGASCGAAAAGARRKTALRAVTEVATVKLAKITGGKATPAPPVGPAIGAFGLNIAMFVKEYNALTADKVGETCPCIVHVMSDKSFKIELKTPLTATLLHKAVGAQKGSGKAGTDIIGTIGIDKLEEIARTKLPDLNCEDISRAMKIVHGTAVASGIKVEGYEEWLETAVPKPKTIMERYGPGVSKLPAPWGEGPPLEEA
ncbi:unnamed protein product [Effrenium voratum]|uniref:50S ribosomal protein L11 n=1 Tax=Effrenium voratum TaxID=2562239 RepID=A0AA36MMG6_9DINO|nr:unnamed protein product [Effrenium voratum]